MTISSTTNTVSYTGTGSATSFSVTYVFFGTGTTAEIEVVEVVIATGAETVKSNGSDFTVSGGSGATGTVTAAVAPASTVKWVINRTTTQTQETDYVENDPFPAESHEEALDRLTAVDQEQQRALERTAQLPDGYTGSFDPTLPTDITGGAVLAFNSAATAFEVGPTAAAISGAEAEATAAAASAATAAAYAGTQTVDRFNGTGSQTAFTLSVAPANGDENNTMVFVSGVYIQKNVYSISGTTLTFASAPASATGNIEVMHMSARAIETPADGSVTYPKFASGLVDIDLSSVSGSDDTIASAKAIKTYVDATATSQDLDFQGDSGGELSIDLDSEVLDIAGGAGITTAGSGNTLTASIDSTVATLTGSQTLTNKTLTSPLIAGDTAAGDDAALGYTAAEGLILTGQGSTSDITLKNDADATVFTVPTGTDDILFPDNAKAMWGDGSDLQIYHDGNSNITDAGTGDLILRASNDIFLSNVAGNSIYARFNEGGAVSLYQNGDVKFITTSTGATVTGNIVADVLAAGSTTARAVTARAADVYNVLDWGIVGDGSTDNLSAFNTLMSAVNSAGGGDVFLPDGSYEVTGLGVQVYSNTRIFGGKGAIVKTDDATSGAGCFFTSSNTHNVTLEGFTLHGAYAGGGTITYALYNTGFLTRGGYFRQVNIAGATVADAAACTRINILNMEVRGFADSGIQLENTDDSSVTGCHVEHAGRVGIYGIGLRQSIVNNNRVHDIAGNSSNVYGISLTRAYYTPEAEYPRSEQCVVDGNVVTDCIIWKCLDTHGGKDIIFSNNYAANSKIGIGVDSANPNFGPENITIIGNTIVAGSGTSQHSVSLFGSSSDGKGNSILNNNMTGFGVSNERGSIALSNQIGFKVDGNYIADSVRSAIGINTLDRCSGEITNNYIRDVYAVDGVQGGILIEDGNSFIFIDGNTIQQTTALTGMIAMYGALFTLPHTVNAFGRAAAVVNVNTTGRAAAVVNNTGTSTAVNLPVTAVGSANPFAVGDTVTIAGTVNYNGTFYIIAVSGSTSPFITIHHAYEAETLSTADTFTNVRVDLPITNPSSTLTTNPFTVGDRVTIAGTTNYNGIFDIDAISGSDGGFFITITKAYVAETLAVTDTFITREGVHLGRNTLVGLTTDVIGGTQPLSSTITVKTASIVLQSVAATTLTATGIIPARATVLGVETYNTVLFLNKPAAEYLLTYYHIGDGTDVDLWGTNLTQAGQFTDQTDFTANPAGTWSASARDVVLTAKKGNIASLVDGAFAAAGASRITVYYTDYK